MYTGCVYISIVRIVIFLILTHSTKEGTKNTSKATSSSSVLTTRTRKTTHSREIMFVTIKAMSFSIITNAFPQTFAFLTMLGKFPTVSREHAFTHTSKIGTYIQVRG